MKPDEPGDQNVTPGYWMYEATGVLAPVVLGYLKGRELSPSDVATMRAYLRQWINAPVWVGPQLDQLRRDIDNLQTQQDIVAWISIAVGEGMDPL